MNIRFMYQLHLILVFLFGYQASFAMTAAQKAAQVSDSIFLNDLATTKRNIDFELSLTHRNFSQFISLLNNQYQKIKSAIEGKMIPDRNLSGKEVLQITAVFGIDVNEETKLKDTISKAYLFTWIYLGRCVYIFYTGKGTLRENKFEHLSGLLKTRIANFKKWADEKEAIYLIEDGRVNRIKADFDKVVAYFKDPVEYRNNYLVLNEDMVLKNMDIIKKNHLTSNISDFMFGKQTNIEGKDIVMKTENSTNNLSLKAYLDNLYNYLNKKIFLNKDELKKDTLRLDDYKKALNTLNDEVITSASKFIDFLNQYYGKLLGQIKDNKYTEELNSLTKVIAEIQTGIKTFNS